MKATAQGFAAEYSKAEKSLYDFYEALLENKHADAMAAKGFPKEEEQLRLAIKEVSETADELNQANEELEAAQEKVARANEKHELACWNLASAEIAL